ncbi:MAG: pirin family protein [Candidatus Aminicenantes bacterium]|nr:pirin family protein [Candidatus Aminicenantes bacterium]
MAERKVKKVFAARPTLEGAGVKLKRAFGFREVPLFDPFLMLDDFGSKNPDDYTAGFPWHPHRGIETVTYMLEGHVDHGDSLGNSGTVGPGQVQWMTAGRGIVHQEMPRREAAGLRGLQLWINLPRAHKMTEPRYRDISAESIPTVRTPEGAEVKIIAGRFQSVGGPVREIFGNPEYLDVTLPPGTPFVREIEAKHGAFAYVMEGSAEFGPSAERVVRGQTALFGSGPAVRATAGPEGARFALISGRPWGQPVAWRGPIVMNTEEELDQAFREYENGTFLG